MKDFYEFLNGHNGGNFFGFLIFVVIFMGGMREIVNSIFKHISRRADEKRDELRPKKSTKQQLND